MCYRNSKWLYRIWWMPLRFMLDQTAVIHYAVKGDFKNSLAVWKGYAGFIKWLFTVRETPNIKRSLVGLPEVLKHSILWLYFLRGKKTFSSIIKTKK